MKNKNLEFSKNILLSSKTITIPNCICIHEGYFPITLDFDGSNWEEIDYELEKIFRTCPIPYGKD